MFREVYATITEGNSRWNSLEAPDSLLYPWDASSTYIKSPPFFEMMVSVWGEEGGWCVSVEGMVSVWRVGECVEGMVSV